jgi:hypothetical protein
MNRSIRRVAAREHTKIHTEFWTVVNSFTRYVGNDLPRPELKDNLITNRHNAVWIAFCDHWSRDKSHAIKPDRMAFLNYVTANEETTTTTDHVGHGQNFAPNDKEKNGVTEPEIGESQIEADPGSDD